MVIFFDFFVYFLVLFTRLWEGGLNRDRIGSLEHFFDIIIGKLYKMISGQMRSIIELARCTNYALSETKIIQYNLQL